MNKPLDPTNDVAAMNERFGELSLRMLNETPLAPAWRINFLANFFTGPIYRDIAQRFGLSRPGFVVLFCMSQQPGLVARDIGRVTGQPKNSISRAVSELLKDGLIRRARDAQDKRAKVLAITPEGRNLLDRVVPLFEQRQAAMFAAFTPEEADEFSRLIEKLIYAMPTWVEPI